MDVRDGSPPRPSAGAPGGSPQPQEGAAGGDGGAFAQLAGLLRGLGASGRRGRVALLAGGIVAAVGLNAAGQVRLNVWQGAFYDALEQRDVAAFGGQLVVFVAIVAALLALVVAQTWFHELLKVRLREWLTHDLLDRWLAPKRAHLLAFAGEVGVNPDQRVHEDARRLTELSADLAVGLLQASLLLVSFVGVLWVLSAEVVFAVDGARFAVPGYMVWCALAYALGGSWLAWRVGRPLVGLNAERYGREAELRSALVRVGEYGEAIALHGGEADERRLLDRAVGNVVAVTRALAGGLARLTWVTSGYGWLAIVVPVLVAAPGYFGGDLSFGGLMMVVGAFNQVQQALRWFVDNLSRIADWRATLLRVVAFRDALPALEALGGESGRIRVEEHPEGRFALEDVSVTLADGRAALDEARVEVAPGERVLIVGGPGSGKSTLFRALAGLWPWGSGTVRMPPRGVGVMFLPQRPYLPLGTLRTALCYPAGCDGFPDAAVRAALERVGLGHLGPSLDREERWDKALPLDEQQRLAFARLLLHAPRWVFLDDATAALDEGQRRAVLSIFERELAGTALVDIGRGPAHDGFYARTLHLARVPDRGERLRPARVPMAAAAVRRRPGGGSASSGPDRLIGAVAGRRDGGDGSGGGSGGDDARR